MVGYFILSHPVYRLGPISFLARRSLSIERKRYWCRPFAYPICRTVCVSGKYTAAKRLIGPRWRLGYGEWGRSRDGCIRRESTYPKGKGGFVGF